LRPFYCVFHSVFTAEGHAVGGPFWRPSYGRLDTACLFMQWTLVAVITGGLMISFKDKKSKDEQKQ
jgi:hypothetical protein